MRVMGVISESKLKERCSSCKYYKPLIKRWHGIETKFARGGCYIGRESVYKSRTETCKKWEENKSV